MYKNKIYDYDVYTFKTKKGNQRCINYYLKKCDDYINVSKEIYFVCKRSYEKIKYDKKREVARSVQYFYDIDQAASFILDKKQKDINYQLYIKELANIAINEIYKLPDKYKDLAICLFLNEMTERETADKLNIPKSTVHKRKIKIQKLLQEKIKKVTK